MIIYHKEYLTSKIGELRAKAVLDYLSSEHCLFKITRPRISKRGDFRVRGKQLVITVNLDENPYRFVITLIHELAHLKTYREYGFKISPHGTEWKENNRILLNRFDVAPLFDISEALRRVYNRQINYPKACSGIDIEVEKVLSKYDLQQEQLFLDQIPEGAEFKFREQIYRKLSNRRSRVLCMNLYNLKNYTINRATQVDPL